MWLASVLAVASSVLSKLVQSYYSIKNNYINTVLLYIMSLVVGEHPPWIQISKMFSVRMHSVTDSLFAC